MPSLRKNVVSKSESVYLGVDPGMKGGLSAIHPSGVAVVAMPETEKGITDWFRCRNTEGTIVTVEWIHPCIVGIHKGKMAKLYGNYMGLRMACIAFNIPMTVVQPVKWQRSLGIEKRREGEKTNKWKDRLLATAKKLYPYLDCWKGSLDFQRRVCDSLLIAEYGKRVHQGLLP